MEVWMVELNGIEASRSHRERDTVALHERGAAPPKPPRRSTVRSSSRPAARSINAKFSGSVIGGAERDRTVDLLNAIQALSQTELQPHGEGENNTSRTRG